jgi:hypothetical protein
MECVSVGERSDALRGDDVDPEGPLRLVFLSSSACISSPRLGR